VTMANAASLAEMTYAAAGSGLGRFATLFALPFCHEDTAIVWGGYLIAQGLASPALVVAALYGGILASDLAIFGIGAGARHVGWLKQRSERWRLTVFEQQLGANFFRLMVLSRIVPGLLFPVFLACGWSGVGLARFMATSVVLIAVQLAVLLGATLLFGNVAFALPGYWPIVALFALLVALGLGRMRLKGIGAGLVHAQATAAPCAAPATSHGGMPPLRDLAGRVAMAERVPPPLFYVPVVMNWIRLGLRHGSMTLPTAANPRIATGGMWGESKSACLDQIGPEHDAFVAAYVCVARGEDEALGGTVAEALARLDERGIGFPLVAKPDVGWQGYGVRCLSEPQDLAAYLAGAAPGAGVILQELVPDDGEAAILYAREPGADRGRIVSLTLRYYPHVVGDGTSSVRELVHRTPRGRWKRALHVGRDGLHSGLSAAELARVPGPGEIVRLAFIGSARAGGLYRDLTGDVTAELEGRVDAIARSMQEFHYGRFDVRFRSFPELRRGLGFKIFEINGIGGEAIDIWDPERTVSSAYRTLFDQQELLFTLGARNRERGFEPEPLTAFLSALRRQTKLIRAYPTSA
jgi:membrane protein DedA with SNARE-associated domain